MANIEFNMGTVGKCQCPGCPVQAQSNCAMDKLDTLKKIMGSDPPEATVAKEKEIMSHPEHVPGVYCATGTAACPDLDPNKMCQCSTCDVWKENRLGEGEPGGYFCAKGKAP
jgi:hypothetical protein